jgi:Galactose oxidase, central domain
MTQTALPAPHPAPRRRVVFGLFDADGWSWAFVKALFWFVVIIMMLGYIPDRFYYITVQKTVDLGVLIWSPVNLCPPENETLPCPAPVGATLPWQPNPAEVALPAPRTDGAAALMGQTYVFAGGSDGTSPKADVWVSHVVGTGNLDTWSAGPSLPEARSDAAYVAVGNTMYVIGGFGPDGKPTSTTYGITVNSDGTLPAAWTTEDALTLPEPRAGASAVAVSDGLVVLGGTDGTAATRSVWKSQQDKSGKFGPLTDQQPLFEANSGGVALHVSDIIYVVGGTNADGLVVPTVQMGLVGGPNATAADPNMITAWRASTQTNLPGPRTNMSGFTGNGNLYVQGGSDGSGPQADALWALPLDSGAIQWFHLDQTDLGEGVQGAAGVLSGPFGFLFGGETASGPTAGIARAYGAPQPPFFQLGILGMTIPALSLGGEVGQQIGYLNAATVGAINFVILILIGYAFNHKEKVRALAARLRRRT